MLYAGRPFRVRRILVAVSGDLWNRWNCDNPDLDPRESTPDLYAALKHHWGYDSFRPMQERIVQSLLGGSDVAVIMPIGGGKSLWFTPGGGQVVARVIPEGIPCSGWKRNTLEWESRPGRFRDCFRSSGSFRAGSRSRELAWGRGRARPLAKSHQAARPVAA